MHKLLTPGPVPIPEFVKAALAQPVIHHRTPEFTDFYKEFLADLRYFFQTEQGVCTCIGSGTYGVEMAIYSMFAPGDEILVTSHGKFSKRWAAYAHHLGIRVHTLEMPWGKSPSRNQILEKLEQAPQCKGVVLTHSETSTGAILDLEEIAFAVKRKNPDILLVVDGITSVGALPYYHDAWGIDCSVIASQKALMNPAGLVGFAFSEQAKSRLRETYKGDFQNLRNHLLAAESFSSAFTAPVQLLFGVQAALSYFRKETLPSVWNRVHQTAVYFRREIGEMGGSIFPDEPSDSLTSFTLPISQFSISEIKAILDKKYGLILSGGQGDLEGKILRVSHMGLWEKKDMEEIVIALRELLSQ